MASSVARLSRALLQQTFFNETAVFGSVKVGAAAQIQPSRGLKYYRHTSTVAREIKPSSHTPSIKAALPGQHLTAKVLFDDDKTADFKYIWLRDNCRCQQCLDPETKQKLLDTPSLDVNVKPKSVTVGEGGSLQVVWQDEDNHVSTFNNEWLYKYGQSFMHNTFESDSSVDKDMSQPVRSAPILWDRTAIWANLPEMSFNEFIASDQGLFTYLDMFQKYGLVILRGVPTEDHMIKTVVEKFAYVKQTQYGITWDMISEPNENHLAYSGLALAYHTDLNYREKSPGMQLLHCLKANDPSKSGVDAGGRSKFVDGVRAARWMEENEPTAFHVLTSTPIRFSIKRLEKRYSALWPVICTDLEGDITEIHYNNRTMQPLQAPTHVVTPFYHAYKLFSSLLNEPSAGLEFNMVPGDLVAFNNRRVLHGRTAFDASVAERHLKGCYVDIDEAFSKYDELLVTQNK